MAEQRVTDDVLDHWASEVAKEPPGKLGSIDLPAVVGMLIAELRASRAREAELAAEVETWQGRCSANQDDMTRFRRRAVAAEAERDVLQQRIDKAPAIPGVPGHRPEPVTVGNGQDKGQESVLTFERAVQDAAAEAMGGTDNGEEMVALWAAIEVGQRELATARAELARYEAAAGG